MAVTDSPFGFKPIGTVSGGQFTGTTLECAVPGGDGSDTFIGDLVAMDGGGTTTGTLGATKTGLPTVIRATAATTNPILGAITGFAPRFTDLELNYAKGSDPNDRTCYVAVAEPHTLFIAQEDGGGDVLTVADLGSTIDMVDDATGDTVYGVSPMEINSDTTSVNATKQLRLVSLYQDEDNALSTGTTAGTIWVVAVSETQFGQSTVATAVGV